MKGYISTAKEKMQKLFDEIRVEQDGIGVFFDETFIIQIP